jgi:hypothetical protein
MKWMTEAQIPQNFSAEKLNDEYKGIPSGRSYTAGQVPKAV